MARGITAEQKHKVAELRRDNPDYMGPALGDIVYRNNIPPSAIAAMLDVAAPTLYRWFYMETDPRGVYHKQIRRLLALLRKAERGRDLPLRGTYQKRVKALGEIITKYKTVTMPAA